MHSVRTILEKSVDPKTEKLLLTVGENITNLCLRILLDREQTLCFIATYQQCTQPAFGYLSDDDAGIRSPSGRSFTVHIGPAEGLLHSSFSPTSTSVIFTLEIGGASIPFVVFDFDFKEILSMLYPPHEDQNMMYDLTDRERLMR